MTETVYNLPVSSTALLQGIKFLMLSGRKCSLEYSYESKKDFLVIFEKLIFNDVESFKCTYHKACSAEMIKAYDEVVSIDKSQWFSEVKQNLSQTEVNTENLRHFRIYFDDGPCYEFICSSFEVLNELEKHSEVFSNSV